jgi:hypothetical protein
MPFIYLLVSFLTFSQTPALSPAAHDFKLSVCEIVYAPEKQTFTLKFYLFHDDLKAVLYNNPNAPEIEAKAASEYVLKHFDLSLDGQPQALTYQSIREKNDQVLVEFSTPKISPKANAKLTVRNSLLIEKFRDQINMLYLILPEKEKKTMMLNATKTEGSFSF